MHSPSKSSTLFAAVFAAFAAGAARAEYPAQDIISLNISNDSSYKMEGSGETETLAGTLPDAAWQNTSNADRTGVVHSGDARNGYRKGVTAWDGATQSVTNLAGVVFTWAVEGSGVANYGSAARPQTFQSAWLARLSTEAADASIVLQNIPYEKYDVIVYCSGSDRASDMRVVCINGVPYGGSTSAEYGTTWYSGRSSSWGNRQDTLELGKNALKVAGLTGPDLHLFMRNATYYGISAVQIVRDMSAGIGNAQRATGKVISVNLQSAKNTSGYTTGDIGIVRVPAEAWTADGLSLADNNANYDSDVNVAIKEWDGATGTTSELTGITLHENVTNAYYYGASSYVPQPQVISSYADDSARPVITVTGVPYRKYDVIVYCATDTEDRYFGPVTVNGTPYRWSKSGNETQAATGDTSTSATAWGFSRCRVMAYGGNALRITDQTSATLTIKGANNAHSCRGGIAGFQIVNAYDPDEATTRTIPDGGTFEIGEEPTEMLRIVCSGSFTIKGVNGYTVTDADLLNFDFDSVAGTITLGENTRYDIGASRTLPEGYAFGSGSTVAMTETPFEYANDRFFVSGLDGVTTVELSRCDGTGGTTEYLAVTGGVATFGDGTNVKVTGMAALYDFTFTNTVSTAGGSRAGSKTMNHDGSDAPGYDQSSDGTGVEVSPGHPYMGMSGMCAWPEFSAAFACKAPSEAKKCIVGFGRGLESLLFLATGEKEDEIVVGYGNGSSAEILATISVSHASEARHCYILTLGGDRKTLTVYVDGIKWKVVYRESGFSLGTSTNAGVQIGKGLAQNPAGYGSAGDGVFYALLVYEYVLSEAQIGLLGSLYPYESKYGSYSRVATGETDFATTGETWTKEGDSLPAYNVPADGSKVVLTASGDADVTVNATLAVEALTLGGSGAITLKKGDGLLTSAGPVVIATGVVIEAGAADVSGSPLALADGGSVRFDYSGFDIFGYYGTVMIPLTGETEEQPAGVISCDLPSAPEHSAEFVYEGGCYQLRIVCREAGRVYLESPVDAVVFDDETEVSWTEDGVKKTGYATASDTVCFSWPNEVEVKRTHPVAGFDFEDKEGFLLYSVAEGDSLVETADIAGAGTVRKVDGGELVMEGDINAAMLIEAGTVKLAHLNGEYSFSTSDTPVKVQVEGGAALDIGGSRGYKADVTLANGATWTNTGRNNGTGYAQAHGLSLSGDATVDAVADFGLLANGWGATVLELNGHTLSKTGTNTFILCNCTMKGTGTIRVEKGRLQAYMYPGYSNRTVLDAPGLTVELVDADFKVSGGNGFSCGPIAGTGTLDMGTTRPSHLNFADGNYIDVKIVLASTTEESVYIPCTGQPRNVSVYEPDGSTPCTAASVSFTGGKISVSVDVFRLTRNNPVTGSAESFTNAFCGTKDSQWETVGNWYANTGNRRTAYGGAVAPAISTDYYPLLFDGDIIANGNKAVTCATKLEGWELKVAVLNGATVSIEKVGKQQGGCWYMVDESSKLVMGANAKSGNCGGNVDIYVAAEEGMEFTSLFDFAHNGSNTVNYYLSGDGSVVYDKGVATGTHNIMQVRLPAGLPKTHIKKLIKRKLVSFGSRREDNVAFSFGSAAVTCDDTTLSMSAYSATEAAPVLTADSPLGTYQLTQEDDGVYIRYVGYGKPFSIVIH